MELQPIVIILIIGALIVAFIPLLIFVLIPLFKGVGWLIASIFRAIGWLFMHVFEFIGGMCKDVLRFIGGLLVVVLFMPMVPLNVILGRWSAAGHFAEAIKRECHIGSACLYRVLLRRPLKLFMLHGVLEGLEQRVPEVMHAVPTSDTPNRRTGEFDGYTIVGSLRSGGSGAKLYIAEPKPEKRARIPAITDRVVIKSFALSDGSSLPQIVRESRALECAKQLGLVFDHGMDSHRFHYVMPYIPGDHLGIITRQMHGESDGGGLSSPQLVSVMRHTRDLLATLAAYHRGGLWHKDVKPENVIVHDGKAQLVDLGLVTPLRSAMTLTTHGTEYFRDPEMVRMALRGVKVHQVDGAKFDIYAAGAVLYFMIENTFPAHGGLSAFAKKSPESVRWIIRRAMAEYNKRYATSEQMLADLAFVLNARDPYQVKPAELPSMTGGGFDASLAGASEAGEQVIAAAAAPVPRGPSAQAAPASPAPALEGYGLAAGIGTAGRWLQVGKFSLDENYQPVPGAVQASAAGAGSAFKPVLRVKNWWTGAYEVGGHAAGGAAPSASPAAMPAEFAAARHEAQAFRRDAEEINQRFNRGEISARRAAREQIKAARARAADIRRRARDRRKHRPHRAVAERQPSVAVGLIVVLFLVGAGFAVAKIYHDSTRSQEFLALREFHQAQAIADAVSQRPLILVNQWPGRLSPEMQARVNEIIARQQEAGYYVLHCDDPTSSRLSDVVAEWRRDSTGPADAEIENLLEEHDAYGLLVINVRGGRGSPADRLDSQIIRSTRAGAEHRIGVSGAIGPRLPLLLVNDHPAATNPDVEKKIAELKANQASRGYEVILDDDAEVEVRRVMAQHAGSDAQQLAEYVADVCRKHALGGVMWITLGDGDLPPSESVSTSIIHVLSAPSPGTAIEPPDAPAPAAPQTSATVVAPPAPARGK
jgi:hypothetical protein